MSLKSGNTREANMKRTFPMSTTHHKSAASVSRGPLAGRIAGAAVAATLFLGAPLLGTLIVQPAVAVADDGFNFAPIGPLFCPHASIRPNDCDGDGIADHDEPTYHTDATLADTDGDGRNDGDEILTGKNPVNPNDGKDPVHEPDFRGGNFDFGFHF
jgi:hypothetical protein